MDFIQRHCGVSLWKLTSPSKLIFGMCIMLSGSVLAAQDLMFR